MKNILIIEDNTITSKGMSDALYREFNQNINVYIAKKIEEAYTISLLNRIDVFIIDIILDTHTVSDVSGLKLAEQIRKNEIYAFTPIIFITVLTDPELYTYRDLHAFAYLEKPFSMQDAIRIIRKALKAPSIIDDKRQFYFRKDGILYAVKTDEIVYIQVRNHVMTIYMTEEILEVPYITIKKFLKNMDNRLFMQCNRSTLISKKFIKNIDLSNKCIGLSNPYKTVDIGPTFYKKVISEIEDVTYN